MVLLPSAHRNLLSNAWGIASVEKSAEAARRIAGLSAEEIEAAQEECRRSGKSGRVREVDARTDVHALGVMPYEILTGSRPYRGRTAVEAYTRIVREEAARPSSLLDQTRP